MNFFKREQLPTPEDAKRLLELIPAEFSDDGCSNAPDGIFGFDFKWACRIHNWSYCTRCHGPGTRTHLVKVQADNRLKRHIDQSLPFRWSWVKYVYYTAVWRYGGMGAFNSCGPEVGFKCRHQMVMPEWMLKISKTFDKITETETDNGS